MCNTRQRGNSCSKWFSQHLGSWSPCRCPSTPFQTLFTVGIWGGLVPASLAKMGMKTTEWESSGMWKCWCPNWWKTWTARIRSWLCFFTGMWQNFYKSEMGVAKNTYYLLTEGSLYNHTEVFSQSMSTFEILVILTSVNYHMLTSRSVGGEMLYIYLFQTWNILECRLYSNLLSYEWMCYPITNERYHKKK